ncbi:MAG: flagellar hook protein [Epsilonproteobacteria bacterium]|nr:flagellar hook protein [Campylobacterota bacterium]
MRISSNYLYDSFLQYDKLRQNEITRYTEEISSGKKILNPSDDFVSVAKALKAKETTKEIDSYLDNITTLQNRQAAAETALNDVMDAGTEARVELVRLLSYGVVDQEDAEIIDDYLQGLKDYIIDRANTKVGDTYLFGGTASDTPPFDENGVYQGNNSEQMVPVSKGYEVNATYDGSNYLATNEDGKIKIVDVIDTIHNQIEAGDLRGITDDLLAELDEGLSQISQYRSKIGSQAKTTEDFRLQHETTKVYQNDLISNLEDTDVVEAITQLEQSKMAYEASMAVYTQNKDLNLLKYFAS